MAGGGGSEPNLTPFIDLFSVLICFLLMTSAVIQLESMPSSIEKPKADSPAAEVTPPPNPDEKKVTLVVSVFNDRVVMKQGERETSLSSPGAKFSESQIKAILAQWRILYPDKKDIVLNTENNVTYGSMIKMYDLLVASNWPDVGISPQ